MSAKRIRKRVNFPYPQLDVPNPIEFMDTLESQLPRSSKWTLERNHAPFRAVVAKYIGSDFGGRGLRVSICVDDKLIDDPSPKTVIFATIADRWDGDDKVRGVTDRQIRAAFDLFRPLVVSVCRALNIDARLQYPKAKPPYRIGAVTKMRLDAFCLSANPSCLHPNDWERFYQFIHFCHAHNVRLGPSRFREALSEKFPAKLRSELADRYGFGRSLLRKSNDWTDEPL